MGFRYCAICEAVIVPHVQVQDPDGAEAAKHKLSQA